MSKTVILVCAHKQDACLKTPPYQPVQVGRAISQTELPFAVGDDTGDNISDRNRHYCELTAHYWAWKNLHDADYIGLNHYRRYFDFEGGSACSLRTVRSEAFFSASHPVPDFDRLFSRCDIVMARPKIYPYNLYTDYCKCHIESDLLTARQVIAEKYPAYLPDFDRVFFRNNRLSHFNMFVLPRERFEAYSAWLFDILFEVERRIEIQDDPVQGRVMGYLSERLLSVWVRHNRLKICYKTVLMVNDQKRKGLGKHLSIRRSILWRTGSLIRCGAARRVGQRNNLLPEAPHPGLRPAMAPHRQATAAQTVAIAGIGVEREPQRLLLRRITKPFGNDGPENILVAQVVAHRTKPLDLVAVFFARGPKTLHAAKRKTSVSDLPVERLPDHPARPLCTAKPPPQVLLQNRQIIHFAADPGSGHTVVSPTAPVGEFVPENPGVGMADQEIFVIAEQLVESGRKHHPVVSRNPVLAAQPFVRHLPNRQSGELTPDRRAIHTAGNQEFDRIIFL